MKNIFITILFFIGVVATPQKRTNSPYSLNGLGELNFRGNQASRFMGGLDVFTDSIHVNLNNPASYGELKYTTYSLGIHYKKDRLSTATDEKNLSTAGLDYLAIGIPTSKFGFGFGLIPYSSVGYKIQTAKEDTRSGFEGSGGINQAFFSVGFMASKYFTVGGTVNYNFGNLSYKTVQFVKVRELGAGLDSKSSVSGFNYQLSVNVNVALKNGYFLKGMYSIQPEVLLKSRNEKKLYTQYDSENIDLEELGLKETTLRMSETQRLGIGFGKEKKWFIGMQYNLMKSANFRNEFMQLENVKYSNGNRFSVGGFFVPEYNSFVNYWRRVAYLFGFHVNQTGLVVNDISVKGIGVSFGVGLPMRGLSNVNIGLEIGRRGQHDANLVRETYFALRMGLSLNDIWFIKRKYN